MDFYFDCDGKTETPTEAYDWCKQVVDDIRKTFDNDLQNVKAFLWGYDHDDHEFFSLDFEKTVNSTEEHYSISILLSPGEYKYDWDIDHLIVSQSIEALHIVGIITQSLNLRLIIGNLGDEGNKDITTGEHNRDIKPC